MPPPHYHIKTDYHTLYCLADFSDMPYNSFPPSSSLPVFVSPLYAWFAHPCFQSQVRRCFFWAITWLWIGQPASRSNTFSDNPIVTPPKGSLNRLPQSHFANRWSINYIVKEFNHRTFEWEVIGDLPLPGLSDFHPMWVASMFHHQSSCGKIRVTQGDLGSVRGHNNENGS